MNEKSAAPRVWYVYLIFNSNKDCGRGGVQDWKSAKTAALSWAGIR
jgi:hypothetical protein